MPLGFAFALLAAPAAMPTTLIMPVIVADPTPKELRERQRRDAAIARLCNKALHRRDALASLDADADTLADVAERLWYGHLGCRKNPGLAIAVQRFAIGGDALRFGDVEMVTQLARYLRDRGDSADQTELIELEGILWVRGAYFSFRPDGKPQWSVEQKRAFIARDDIWAFLAADTKVPWLSQQARLEALRDPLSPRYAPVEAVTIMEAGLGAGEWVEAAKLLRRGQGLPRDDVRADALLLKAAPYVDEARLLVAPILAKQLGSADPGLRHAAAQQFGPWSRASEPGAGALRSILIPYYRAQLTMGVGDKRRGAAAALTQYALAYPSESDSAPILRWIDAVLRKDDIADEPLAWRSLGSLVNAKQAGAEEVMHAAFARAGGLVDGGTLRAADVKKLIAGDDYPMRALREQQEDLVDSEVIVAPDGRPLFVVVNQSRSPQLGEAVRTLITRRFRARDMLPYPGRYVRAKLPPIQFRLPTCAADVERTPAVGGALLVDADYCPKPLADTVIP